MRIGQLAANTGLSADTIRFYEREGLTQQSERSSSGYRLYTEMDVRRLRSIGRAQSLGFTLQEIRELFMIDESGSDSCFHVQEMIAGKLEQVREKMHSLRQVEENLLLAQARCQGAVSARELCSCPVLQHLSPEDGNAAVRSNASGQ